MRLGVMPGVRREEIRLMIRSIYMRMCVYESSIQFTYNTVQREQYSNSYCSYQIKTSDPVTPIS